MNPPKFLFWSHNFVEHVWLNTIIFIKMISEIPSWYNTVLAVSEWRKTCNLSGKIFAYNLHSEIQEGGGPC